MIVLVRVLECVCVWVCLCDHHNRINLNVYDTISHIRSNALEPLFPRTEKKKPFILLLCLSNEYHLTKRMCAITTHCFPELSWSNYYHLQRMNVIFSHSRTISFSQLLFFFFQFITMFSIISMFSTIMRCVLLNGVDWLVWYCGQWDHLSMPFF